MSLVPEKWAEILDHLEANHCAECEYDNHRLVSKCRDCAEIDQAEQDYDHDKGN